MNGASIHKKKPRKRATDEIVPAAPQRKRARTSVTEVMGYKVYEESEFVALYESPEVKYASKLWKRVGKQGLKDDYSHIQELKKIEGGGAQFIYWDRDDSNAFKIRRYKEGSQALSITKLGRYSSALDLWVGSIGVYVRTSRCRKPRQAALMGGYVGGSYSYDDYKRTNVAQVLRYLNFHAGISCYYLPRESIRFDDPEQPWNATIKDRQCVAFLSASKSKLCAEQGTRDRNRITITVPRLNRLGQPNSTYVAASPCHLATTFFDSSIYDRNICKLVFEFV